MLRLTLRTLLAWLDGVLPPAEADSFAEKLATSGSARILVDRIRAVVAHPGLDAPKVVGRGLGADANSVAEYLTNSLPTDAVAAFERVCIESDSHLAEVASCHRMLVEARNDPRIFEPPEPHDLDRLLIMTGSLAGAAEAAAKKAASRPSTPRPAQVSAERSPPDKPVFSPSSRAGGPKTSPMAWASVTAALLLLGLLAGTLAWRLVPHGLGGSAPRDPDAVAVREPPPPRPQPPLPPSDEAVLEPKPAVQADQSDEEPQPGTTVASEPAARETERAVEEPHPAAPQPDSTVAPAPQPASEAKPPAGRVPGGEALAIAAKSPQPPVAAPAAAVPEAAVEQPPAGEPAFATVGGIPLLLNRIGEAGGPADWEVIPAGTRLSKAADLLVPEDFFPTLAVGKATIRLIGPARAVLRPRHDAAAELELVFGRAILSGIEPGRPLAVAAGQLAGRIAGGDPIGLEVRFERPPGRDPETVPSTTVGSIAFPAGGRLEPDPELAANMEAAAVAAPPGAEGLIGPDGTIATGVVVTGRGVVSRGLPGWLASPSPPRLLDRLAADAMAASLAAAPTVAALERLLEDSRLENRSAAAATLAVMGRYEPLAALLAAEEPGRRLPSRAWETLERATIPLALARGPTSAARLLAALESVVPPDDRKLVRQLAVGFSEQSVAGGGDAAMVAGLESPSLLVRRLAAARLVETVPLAAADRLRYRPDGRPDARAEAVKWWRSQLEKGRIRGGGEGGLSKAEGE